MRKSRVLWMGLVLHALWRFRHRHHKCNYCPLLISALRLRGVSFSNRQSLTDKELFQLEWVPDQSKNVFVQPWCCGIARSFYCLQNNKNIVSSTQKTWVVITRKQHLLRRDREIIKSRSRGNRFCYVEIVRKFERNKTNNDARYACAHFVLSFRSFTSNKNAEPGENQKLCTKCHQ